MELKRPRNLFLSKGFLILTFSSFSFRWLYKCPKCYLNCVKMAIFPKKLKNCPAVEAPFTDPRMRQTQTSFSFKFRVPHYRPFAVNSSVHLVKKFEWQLIFCLNTLIFISQTHMQKFSIYFPAVFF